jgi:histidinol-phosphatase (PHP family)
LSDFQYLKPLEINGLADYHCHCDYSIDAIGSIDEYCQAALQRELAEICFTTHYDFNPKGQDGDAFMSVKGERRPANHETLALYVEDVRKAHEKFYPMGLSVLLGLEFGWYNGCEEEVIKLKERFGFDYFLVGIHEIDNICYCCTHRYEKCFSRYTLEKMGEMYYRDVIQAARSGLFNTIAHLDYYRKFGELFYGPAVHQIHQPFLPDVFSALKGSGTTIEVNTSARRKGFDSFYPQNEIINAARKAGVDIIYLGSDAHTPEHVGYEFDEASVLVPPVIDRCDD